jgi:mannose-6-phosphate isomerase-like protein (cupin superfamily)
MIVKKQDADAIDFGGLTIFDYTSNLKESSSFAVIEVPPGASHRLSWSKRSDKFYYVIDGRIGFTLNGENHILDRGDFCIVRKGEKFKYRNDSRDAALIALVHTPGFELSEEVFE